MNQLHQNLLISSTVALRAWRETILSLNSKTYKIGMVSWQNPTLKKTGNSSPGLEISYNLELLSSNTSSNQAVDLIPKRCSSVIERNEWSNFISMISRLIKPEGKQTLREIQDGAIKSANNVHHKFSIPEISFVNIESSK